VHRSKASLTYTMRGPGSSRAPASVITTRSLTWANAAASSRRRSVAARCAVTSRASSIPAVTAPVASRTGTARASNTWAPATSSPTRASPASAAS
jgi:hypothetical protein